MNYRIVSCYFGATNDSQTQVSVHRHFRFADLPGLFWCKRLSGQHTNYPTRFDIDAHTGRWSHQPTELETATVAQVVDGDTIELVDGQRVRYTGINTPERDQPYYKEATEMNRQLVGDKEVQLEFDVETFDRYGRTLAYIWVDGQMVNLVMIREGYANAFTVPPNVKYEEQFRQAEREAREAERGLWTGSDVALEITHIEANAPGNDNENPNGEWIEIANQGREPVQMENYTLKDEANHIYTYGAFAVAPGVTVRLFSGQGQDSPTELYWGLNGESIGITELTQLS